MSSVVRKGNGAKRYARTGSFGRLNGRAVAPGSDFPENYFLRRRIAWIVIAAALALPGIVALVW